MLESENQFFNFYVSEEIRVGFYYSSRKFNSITSSA